MVKNRYSQWGGNQHLHGHQLALYVVLFETADRRSSASTVQRHRLHVQGGSYQRDPYTTPQQPVLPSRALEGAGSPASGQWQLAVASIVTSRLVYRVEQCGVHVGTEISMSSVASLCLGANGFYIILVPIKMVMSGEKPCLDNPM